MKKVRIPIMLAIAATSAAFVSCDSNNDEPTNPTKETILVEQLEKDYGTAISNLSWSSRSGFEIASFTLATKADDDQIEAWYKYDDDAAERYMESRDLGTDIPSVIKTAFEATPYSDAAVWKIDEVELEEDFNESNAGATYEVELENIADSNLEATLVFDATTGALLFSKEEIDGDDDDDTKIPVTAEIKAAVEAAYPGAIIVDVEYDDNEYEVDAVIKSADGNREIELELNSNFEIINAEVEQEYTYATLPTEIQGAIAAFNDADANDDYVTIPNDTKVEVEEKIDNNVKVYEVEVDEFMVGTTEYEMSYTIDSEYKITDSEVEKDTDNDNDDDNDND